MMGKSNITKVQDIIDGVSSSKTYYMATEKTKSENIEDIRHDKKEGDVWTELGTKMTLWRGGFITTKWKATVLARESGKMPLVCPVCGRVMRKQYDEKPWLLEKQCRECCIDAEGKMRIAGTWKAYVDNRLRANAKAQIADQKETLEEQLSNLTEKFSVVGNETGELEKWTVPKAQMEKQRKELEARITQLNVLSKEYLQDDGDKKDEDGTI